MTFDPVFAHDVLIPLNTTAYQLSWDQPLKFPPDWQQTGTVTADQSTINRETASGLAKIVISEDWLEDFRAIAQPVPHDQWWMHQGFDDVWNSIAASLQKAWDTASSANAKVYITGHSLGAALALIMGVHHPEALTWTFAGPAVFSPIHGLPPAANVVRVVNPSDLVPKVPIPPLYQHIGQEVEVLGAADQFNFKLQHSLDTYAAGLAKLAV
jgi:predicted lipase